MREILRKEHRLGSSADLTSPLLPIHPFAPRFLSTYCVLGPEVGERHTRDLERCGLCLYGQHGLVGVGSGGKSNKQLSAMLEDVQGTRGAQRRGPNSRWETEKTSWRNWHPRRDLKDEQELALTSRL